MAEANSTTKMAGTTKASGKTTKWTASANSTTKVANWPTKASGRRMSSTA